MPGNMRRLTSQTIQQKNVLHRSARKLLHTCSIDYIVTIQLGIIQIHINSIYVHHLIIITYLNIYKKRLSFAEIKFIL